MQLWLCTIPDAAIHVAMGVDGAASGAMPHTTCVAMHGGIISLGARCPVIIYGV